MYPDLVGRNARGQPESVRYDQINAMLLNEFLKEHSKVKEQANSIAELKSTVAQQRKDFETTTTATTKGLPVQVRQTGKPNPSAGVRYSEGERPD